MRALGFCVSKEHARYMAAGSARPDSESVASTGDDRRPSATTASGLCGTGRLNAVFSVEVLSEGVDVPEVDTVLLLRPTAVARRSSRSSSAAASAAQLDKSHLTVIDLDWSAPPGVSIRGSAASDDRPTAWASYRARSTRTSPSCRPAARSSSIEESRDHPREPQGGRPRSRWPTLVADLRRASRRHHPRRHSWTPMTIGWKTSTGA